MDYAKGLDEARSLLIRSDEDQWRLAEITYEIVVTDGHKLEKWAADLGATKMHVVRLRNVWARYGGNGRYHRTNWSFADYYILSGMSEERAERTERDARRNGRSISSEERSSRPGDRVRAVREALSDPRRREEVLADANIRKLLRQSLGEWQPKPKPKLRRKGYVGELVEINERLTRLLDEMIDAGLSDDERAALLPTVQQMQDIVEWMRSHLETADRSFEDALDALLAGKLPPPRAEPALPSQTVKPIRARKPRPSTPAPEAEPVIEPEPAPEPEEDAAAEPTKGRKSRGRPDKGRRAS